MLQMKANRKFASSESRIFSVALVILLAGSALGQTSVSTVASDLLSWSSGDTLRVDLYHGGTDTEEHVSISSIRREGAWAGSRTQLFDSQNLGDYFLAVWDAKTNLPLYTRGFNSCFDGGPKWSVCSESVRFPFPLHNVRISIGKRNATNVGFYELWNEAIDPASPSIDNSSLTSKAEVDVIVENGRPDTKVDFVILGDGYTQGDKLKFQSDARRAADYLFLAPPFKENKSSFNVRSVFTASEDRGITSPLDGLWAKTVFGCAYNAHDVERDIDCPNNRAIRESAAAVPYDFVIILTNSKRYGGSANFQRFAVLAIDSSQAEYLVQHETGHMFAGLKDEYYTLAS
jgi:hypothetical protein